MGRDSYAIICYGIKLDHFISGSYKPPKEWKPPVEASVFWDNSKKEWINHDGSSFDIYNFLEESLHKRIEIVIHNNLDYPKFILAIKSSVKRAYRGDPLRLKPSDVSYKIGWDDFLIDQLGKLGIPAGTALPEIWLCSFYG